ncbi:MAG: LysR family transcriptional regulator [Myxococcota bacterium]
MRWDDLRVMLAVRRAGSVAGAGRALQVDPSTVSRRLRSLEASLGSPLFDRTPDGLAPTALVEKLIPHAEQAEAAALAIESTAAGAEVRPVGHVRLAVSDSFGAYIIAPAIGAFIDAHPGLEITVLVSTALVDLSRREADIAIRFMLPQTGDLIARRIAGSSFYAGFAHQSYLERREIGSIEDIDWIGWDETSAHLQEARLFEQMVGSKPRIQCDDQIVMVEAMRAGAGAMVLPVPFGSLIPGCVQLPFPAPQPLDLPVWLVTHRALRDVPRVRVVMDWLESLMHDLLRQLPPGGMSGFRGVGKGFGAAETDR